MAGTEKGKLPNYLDDHGRLEKTLKSFTESSGSLKYVDMLQAIADRKKQVFELSLDDLHSVMENELADRIQSNTMGYMDQISKLIDENMPQPSPDADFEKDTLDVLNEDREIGADGDEGLMRSLPPAMHRRYQLVIVHDGQKRLPLRQLRADAVGKLVTVQGIITAATAIKPKIQYAAYICEQCGHEIYQAVKGDVYTPEVTCSSERCKANQNYGRLFFQPRGSKFSKFQELRIQELPEEVPKGSIPRSIKGIHCLLRNGQVHTMYPAFDVASGSLTSGCQENPLANCQTIGPCFRFSRPQLFAKGPVHWRSIGERAQPPMCAKL
jgi:DNA replication licensing factor MCM7